MRYIDGIPEAEIIKQYLGHFVDTFYEDHLNTYSPSRGKRCDVCIYRRRLNPTSRISAHYTGTEKAIYIGFKVLFRDGDWEQTHYKIIPLHDPNGPQKAVEFIEYLIQHHRNGRNKCCANLGIWD